MVYSTVVALDEAKGSVLMKTVGFKVGDKVVSRIGKPDVPAGTPGIIVHVYRSLRGRYTVQFDTSTASAFMWGYDLEPVGAPVMPEAPRPGNDRGQQGPRGRDRRR
jgi:hypothetical protein